MRLGRQPHPSQLLRSAIYHRLKIPRGHKRAVIAVAHSILVTIWHLLSKPAACTDLGPDHCRTQNTDRERRRLVSKLQKLGYDVQLVPAA